MAIMTNLPAPETTPHLMLEGFEGPLDLLLDLARAQKVDLSKISILQLVEQYLCFVETARETRLELAADWLVMAAWLTWLKSRLLLPSDTQDNEDVVLAADLLQERLQDLEDIRRLAQWLDSRPRLGEHVFARGHREDRVHVDRSGLRTDLATLIKAYLTPARRQARKKGYIPPRVDYWSVTEAMAALRRLLESRRSGAWQPLFSVLPFAKATEPRATAAALASLLVAGLEMVKNGHAELRQTGVFNEILLRAPSRENA